VFVDSVFHDVTLSVLEFLACRAGNISPALTHNLLPPFLYFLTLPLLSLVSLVPLVPLVPKYHCRENITGAPE
jgi:hypothetical protein